MLAPVAVGHARRRSARGGLDLHRPRRLAHRAARAAGRRDGRSRCCCFAAAARRIPLVTIGLIQFITPVMQLLCAVLLLGEHMPGARWIGFGIVWVALVLLTVDSMLSLHRSRRASIPVDDCPR